MAGVVRRVGLGLAARGEVRKAVEYARQAADLGLDSVWIHDSYFERDAVTFLAAIATEVPEVKIGAEALNPYTRHPVVLAMTLSALDDLAPGRFILALGSGLPLRLAQMGIPYEDTVAKVSECIDILRELWAGRRLVLNPAVPPLQPMFPPPHHIPIYIAGYQPRFLELCGQKADGYLARPAESVQAIVQIQRRIETAARAAGRSMDQIQFAGYLLCLIDESRRAALNRAKREPFVIYMVSVLSNLSLHRAGFPPELRDQIAAAWRAEDYHRAAELIPDELLDAFILCGTPGDVARRAWQYHRAGMDLPILQPIVQNEEQTRQVLEAAAIYSRAPRLEAEPAAARTFAGVGVPAAPAPTAAEELPLPERVRRKAAGVWEILRPFAFTASFIPVTAGGVLAFLDNRFDPLLFLASLAGGIALQAGTNVVNEIYDVRKGVDQITSPRASHALLKGALTEKEAFAVAFSAFALATVIGIYLVAVRGLPLLILGLIGLAGGYFYTAPPFEYKFRALGVPLVFVLMGPLMVSGAYFAITGELSPLALLVSVPIGFLVAAILHGNEWRDISEDIRSGASTLSHLLGWRRAHYLYVGLILAAYLCIGFGVMLRLLPPYTLLTLLSLPLSFSLLHRAKLGAAGQMRAIAMIDLQTARLHLVFGLLLIAGLFLAAVANGRW
jgi:1,4-dihydroxy-2-naphthoate octaprenyltransferase